jgi:hypothetical protein
MSFSAKRRIWRKSVFGLGLDAGFRQSELEAAPIMAEPLYIDTGQGVVQAIVREWLALLIAIPMMSNGFQARHAPHRQTLGLHRDWGQVRSPQAVL